MASNSGTTARLETDAVVEAAPTRPPKTLERLAIIVREGTYDRILTLLPLPTSLRQVTPKSTCCLSTGRYAP